MTPEFMRSKKFVCLIPFILFSIGGFGFGLIYLLSHFTTFSFINVLYSVKNNNDTRKVKF